MKELRKSKNFENMITEAVKGDYVFFAWQAIGGVIEQCELQIKSYRKEYNDIEFEIDEKQKIKLEKIISGNRILNIYVPELSVSFSSELKSVTIDGKVKIILPLEYSFYERRKHERITPAKSCYVSFEHGGKCVRRSIFDFSIGGLSIVLPKSDKITIAKSKVFAEFTVEIGTKKIKVKAECVNAFSIDRYKLENLPYGGYKIAFRFIEISKEDKLQVAEFITHETLTNKIKKKAN